MTTRDEAPKVDPAEIGGRAQVIRRQRGLSRDTVAALTNISTEHVAQLESGARRFDRRGLIEDVAHALDCSVPDLTGQPYLPVDRASADALAVIPGIREAIYGATLHEPPDVLPGSLTELQRQVDQVHQHLEQDRYSQAGQPLSLLLDALHVHAAQDSEARPAALAALVQTCQAAALIADTLGYQDLALAAAARGHQAATRLDDPTTRGLARFRLAQVWTHAGARDPAHTLNALALAELEPLADPSTTDNSAAVVLGLHHLLAAELAARAAHTADAYDHLDRARALAERTGHQTAARQHFGPTAVALWALCIAADLDDGPRACEQAPDQGEIDALNSRTLTGHYHLALARALAQDESGNRDDDAIRHLNLADNAAPVLLRNHPIARELIAQLTDRTRRYARHLDSMCHRFGFA